MDKDKCVSCTKETKYDKSTPIQYRYHYVEGGGQLCKKCWRETYE